jgi:hypothetical protein
VCPYSLDREELILRSYGVFKVRASPARPARKAEPEARSLKTQQQTSSLTSRGQYSLTSRGQHDVEVNIDLGEPDHGRIGRADPSTSLAATSGNCHWDP